MGSQPSPNQSRPERRKKILSTAFSVVVEYVHICLDWDSIMLCFTANRLFIPNGLFLWPLLSFLAKKDTSLDFGVFILGLKVTWYLFSNGLFFWPLLSVIKEHKFRLWSFQLNFIPKWPFQLVPSFFLSLKDTSLDYRAFKLGVQNTAFAVLTRSVL